jgi:hypothetical protein
MPIAEFNESAIDEIITLERVNLTTPEKDDNSDNCKTYRFGEFPCNDFYQDKDTKGIEFWAPTKGFSSKSTSRTRTEIREVTDRHAAYNWRYTDHAHHFLQAALTVVQAPKVSQETVVGQIHVHGSTRPPLKLSWDKQKIVLGFREAFDQVNPKDTVLLTEVPLQSRWSYSIHVTKTGSVTVEVNSGDRSRTATFKLDQSWAEQGLYFKAGVYNQEDPTDSTTVDEGSRALFHKLSIRHQE